MSTLRTITGNHIETFINDQNIAKGSAEYKALRKFARSFPTTAIEEVKELFEFKPLSADLFKNGKETIEVKATDKYFRASTIKDEKGKLAWFKIPDNKSDISLGRYARWNQLAIEIENGTTGEQLSQNLREVSSEISDKVNNATAGTSPINNGWLLNLSDKVYNSGLALGNFLGIGSDDPTLNMKILEAAALCIVTVNSDKSKLIEDTTKINQLEIEAKIRDWKESGIGMSFFFLLFLNFTPLFKQALTKFSRKSLNQANQTNS